MGFVSDVSRVFVVAVSHGLGPNLAAVRGFRRRCSTIVGLFVISVAYNPNLSEKL